MQDKVQLIKNTKETKLLELISEKEIKDTLISEYEKKLVLYKFTNESLKKKYGMSFKEFEDNNIVKQKGFLWEVENDAMEWEHSLVGIKTLKGKIIKKSLEYIKKLKLI